jgi:hypothetical protein
VLAAVCFLTATAAAVGLGVVRWQGGQTQLEGILLALTTGGIGVGVGVVVWAKRYTPDEEVTEERKSLASTTEELEAVREAVHHGDQSVVGRRLLVGSLGAALAALGAALLFPIRSLGPRPGAGLKRTGSPRMFGGIGDGIADDTKALKAAFAAAHDAGGVLHIPKGEWRYSEQIGTIAKPMMVTGDRTRLSYLRPTASYTGWAFEVHDCWRNVGESPNATVFGPPAPIPRAGVEFRDFSIAADRATRANGIKFTRRNDLSAMHNVGFYYLNGTALGLASEDNQGLFREGLISNCRFHGCGNTDLNEAVIEISTGHNTNDGTNQITFDNCWFVYNEGVVVHIWNDSPTEVLRRIQFTNLMFHGRSQGNNIPQADLAIIEGRLNAINWRNTRINGSHPGFAGIRYRSLSGFYPRRCQITGLDLATMSGDGIVVEKCTTIRIEDMSDPTGIAGDVVRFGANSTDAAVVDLTAPPGGRKIVVHPTVAANVQIR